MKNKNLPYFDAVSMLESENFRIMDFMDELKNMVLSINKTVHLDSDINKKIRELAFTIESEVIKYNTIEEEVLFPELDWVLPFPSSTDAIRDEHKKINILLKNIHTLLDNDPVITDHIEELQSLVISLYNVIERDVHKKNEILFYEAQTKLSKETLDDIYLKLKAILEPENKNYE
jgi:hypothetical protein